MSIDNSLNVEVSTACVKQSVKKVESGFWEICPDYTPARLLSL